MIVGRITLRRRRTLGAIIGDGFRIYGMPDLISMLFILALPGAALNLLLLAGRLRMSGLANSLWIPGSVLGALVYRCHLRLRSVRQG